MEVRLVQTNLDASQAGVSSVLVAFWSRWSNVGNSFVNMQSEYKMHGTHMGMLLACCGSCDLLCIEANVETGHVAQNWQICSAMLYDKAVEVCA